MCGRCHFQQLSMFNLYNQIKETDNSIGYTTVSCQRCQFIVRTMPIQIIGLIINTHQELEVYGLRCDFVFIFKFNI